MGSNLKKFVSVTQHQQEKVYSSYLELDLGDVEPCVSGPKRYMPHPTSSQCEACLLFYIICMSYDVAYPMTSFDSPHDRVPLKEMKADWHSCLNNKVGFKVSSTSILQTSAISSPHFGFVDVIAQ